MNILFTTRLINRFSSFVRGQYCRLHDSKPVFGFLYTKQLIAAPETRGFCSRALSDKTLVAKDLIIYKYENPKFYNMLNAFAICQFIFWNYLSYTAFTTLRDVPQEENEVEQDDEKWYQRFNLGADKYRYGLTIISFVMGYGILCGAWVFCLHSVRFLILRKGGKDISFVTYGPFNKNRILTVPLNNISAQESRNSARVALPIKVQNHKLFYFLDMRGEFRNPHLFDSTAGLKRRINY